jgi:hypothetical protein
MERSATTRPRHGSADMLHEEPWRSSDRASRSRLSPSRQIVCHPPRLPAARPALPANMGIVCEESPRYFGSSIVAFRPRLTIRSVGHFSALLPEESLRVGSLCRIEVAAPEPRMILDRDRWSRQLPSQFWNKSPGSLLVAGSKPRQRCMRKHRLSRSFLAG